jgi:hypothetical protein
VLAGGDAGGGVVGMEVGRALDDDGVGLGRFQKPLRGRVKIT